MKTALYCFFVNSKAKTSINLNIKRMQKGI